MTIPLKSIVQPPVSAPSANTYSDLNGLAALKKDPSSPQAIHAVAQQIDALFLQMMLKSMRDASAEVGEAASNEMSMYQDMFDKQIALSMSQNQSLGLGAQLTRQLSATAGAVPPPTSNLQSAQPAAAPPPGAGTPGQFVSQVFPAIQRAAQALGVNPFAMLAQAVLETGWGKRMARTADGTPSHNMFGIKADDGWSGARVAADTVEFSGGVAMQRRTAFRAYGSIEDSVNDFARLLGSSPRYRDAVAGGGNADAYIEAIGKSGYATDPAYANKLNEIMKSSTFRGALMAHSIAL
ncbi:MAG: glucosaminidase domain-containing protein [Steroidobacteraceae bacterium]|jgi:flagellar protein FlgJ